MGGWERDRRRDRTGRRAAARQQSQPHEAERSTKENDKIRRVTSARARSVEKEFLAYSAPPRRDRILSVIRDATLTHTHRYTRYKSNPSWTFRAANGIAQRGRTCAVAHPGQNSDEQNSRPGDPRMSSSRPRPEGEFVGRHRVSTSVNARLVYEHTVVCPSHKPALPGLSGTLLFRG